MPIVTNQGGVLHNLSPIYVRNGAVLNELSTVYARTGSVLSTIYEKDSGSGGGGGNVVTSGTETFNWGNYTGTANTTPVCIGSFTINQFMNCTASLMTSHKMINLCPTPTEMNLSGYDVTDVENIEDIYLYKYNIHIKNTMDVNGSDLITWKNDVYSPWHILYKYDKSTKKFTLYSITERAESGSSGDLATNILQNGTYYIYFSNYIELRTMYDNAEGATASNFIKYMPWDNMSTQVNLKFEPIT